MSRRLSNWIDSFVEYAQVFNTPERYRRWGGIWALAAAAGRRIVMQSRGSILAPNLYIILVGGPSTGKSQIVNAVQSVLSPATKYSYIPPSITRAGMEDYMQANLRTRVGPDGKRIASSECIGLSDEMQGILPDQDLGHLTLYNRLYDQHKVHTAVTRSHGEIRLECPYCTLFTGAQPAFLATTLPEGAWGMGFMSRALMVWGVPPPRRSLFVDNEPNWELQANLIADLKAVFEHYGYIKWERLAEGLYNEWWVENGGLPVPKHKRLTVGYNGRREIQMVKLAMIHSLAESNDLIVKEAHVAAAIRTLLEAESQMQHIFNEMTSTGSMMAIEDVLDTVRNNSAADRDTTEAQLYEMLMQRFPSSQTHHIIENLVKSNAINNVGGADVKGFRKFRIGRKVGVG